MDKASGLLDKLRGATGYHNTQTLADMSGVDKSFIDGTYHKLKVPNKLLYADKHAANDMKELYASHKNYSSLQAELMKTKEGSKEEKAFLKIHKGELDKRYKARAVKMMTLSKRYKSIKNADPGFEKYALNIETLESAHKMRRAITKRLKTTLGKERALTRSVIDKGNRPVIKHQELRYKNARNAYRSSMDKEQRTSDLIDKHWQKEWSKRRVERRRFW
jgi:hypothetical protein